ncbi:MAG: response regulator [Cyclobacteriaceae bacterium]|nr:response regulator [Cyclobacteriaceae bacterium]
MSNKILVIEDNEEMCDNIASILKLAHYDVIKAFNGKVGVEIVQQQHPDLILCDVMMPELDGYGVLHILGKDPDTADIPFIFLTAKAEKSDFRTGMNLGADDYITKPFDGLELLKAVEVRLKKNELIKTTFHNSLDDVNEFFNKTRQLKEFHKLSENRPCRHLKRKDFLFMEGQQPNDLFFISKGEIKTYKSNPQGKELITGLHHAGEFIGYVPLLENKAYCESAEVLEDAEVCIIPGHDFTTLIYSNKEIAGKFIKLLANNLFEAEQRLVDLAYQSVRQRVAGTLLKLNHTNTNDTVKTNLIQVSRKDMANIVGTATESLNRTLADFKDEKLIEIVDSGIRILDQTKLARITV